MTVIDSRAWPHEASTRGARYGLLSRNEDAWTCASLNEVEEQNGGPD